MQYYFIVQFQPVIEKKDLVAPSHSEKKIPLFNYLLDTFQNKFTLRFVNLYLNNTASEF